MADIADRAFGARCTGEAGVRLDAHERRIAMLERDGAVSAERFTHIQKTLEHIQLSISRVAWIVLTAVIGGIMTFIIAGGLHGLP